MLISFSNTVPWFRPWEKPGRLVVVTTVSEPTNLSGVWGVRRSAVSGTIMKEPISPFLETNHEAFTSIEPFQPVSNTTQWEYEIRSYPRGAERIDSLWLVGREGVWWAVRLGGDYDTDLPDYVWPVPAERAPGPTIWERL